MTWVTLLCRVRAIFLCALILTGTIFALYSLRANADTPSRSLVLGTEGGFAPYNFLDETGALAGFDIDLGNALCTRSQLTCRWVQHDWNTIIEGLLSGQYDAIIAGMSNTRARREIVAFSSGYTEGDAIGAYLGRFTFSDLATATIAVQANTIHEDHLRARGYDLRAYPTAGAAYNAALTGATDLVFGSPSYFTEEHMQTTSSLTTVWQENLDAGPASIAFRKEDVALRALFEATLDKMRGDGSLQQLRVKWFGAKIDV